MGRFVTHHPTKPLHLNSFSNKTIVTYIFWEGSSDGQSTKNVSGTIHQKDGVVGSSPTLPPWVQLYVGSDLL